MDDKLEATHRVLRMSTDAECDWLELYNNVSVITVFFCAVQIIVVSIVYCFLTNDKYFMRLLGLNNEVIVLPVYNNAIFWTTVCAIGLGIIRLASYPQNSELFYCIKWFVNRFLTDGLAIFLMHNGVGMTAVEFSAVTAFVWASLSAMIPYLIYLHYGMDSFYCAQIIVLSIMGVFYLMNWLAPAANLHRRPALILMSRYYSFVFSLMLSATLILLFQGDHSGCAVNVLLGLGELMMPLLIFRTIYHDSLFWQGLFVRGTANLNEPLLGMWDMGRDTMDIVAQSISDLEQEIVPIIPFGMLLLDTSHYFSGGSARVYRGRYKQDEVAIKFLFCIELTPERVVAFCHEATILNSLQHPNVVKCFGVSVMPPALCLVTEYCNFGSLFDFLHSVDKDTDGVATSEGSRSNTSSRTSSRPSLSNLLRPGVLQGDSMRDDLIGESVGTGVRFSEVEAGFLRHTDHSLSHHSSSAIMMRPPACSTVLSVPERFSLSGASPSQVVRKIYETNAGVLDTVTEKSASEYSVDASLASANQFYNHNIINNLPITIAEADSIGTRSARSTGQASGTSAEGHMSGGHDFGKSGAGSSASRTAKLKSAVKVMRESFLGLGLGPSGAPKAPVSKLTAASIRPRTSSLGSLKSVFSAGDMLMTGAVNNRGFYLSFQTRLKMAYECCLSVAHLHSKGLMHCDIKSLNFLVTNDLSIRLADLGEARVYAGLRQSETQSLPR